MLTDHQRFMRMVRESLHIKHHLQLLTWLQGEFQECIPHQIFVAAWGDFSRCLIQYDIVSPLPAIRTGQISDGNIVPFMCGLFNRWVENKVAPYACSFRDGITLGDNGPRGDEHKAFEAMHSALVHGIRDERGRHDCIYAFLHEGTSIPEISLEAFRVTLPFVDTALRQVAHLPCQYPAEIEMPSPEAGYLIADDACDSSFLSTREIEIMNWVTQGKTNYEIGAILNISTFTVKNHLQRIFRKIDVTNRAQAVSKLRSLGKVPAA
jgi:transcriptional regulator EpsA